MEYRIFVSHVWRAHEDYYLGLERLLAKAKRFAFVDLSVPRFRHLEGSYADARDKILSHLRTADVVLTINTPVITNSGAVRDELTEAERMGIPIIAISPPRRLGALRESQFGAIQRAHKAQWAVNTIVDAIRVVVRARTKRNRADLAEHTYAPAAEVTDAAELSQVQAAGLLGDDEEVTYREDSASGASSIATLSPKEMLSRDFMPLLTRGSLGT